MNAHTRAEAAIDALGLLALLAMVGHALRPDLIVLPTLAAGGDTPGHFAAAAFFAERLLPEGRLHGWFAGAYLGHPLGLYYFPLPFVLMAALAPLVGLPVAFKLVMAAGAWLLPLTAWAALRLLGLRFPAPLAGACAAAVFLFVPDNPIWGGTLSSMLAGEFCYAWGLLFALLFLGAVYRAYGRDRGPLAPALLLSLAALSHGYAVLWAGASALFLLAGSRKPARALGFLLSVAGLAFALAGVFLLPLLWDWGWTTAYDDPWIEVGPRQLVPLLLLPLFGLAASGLLAAFARGRREGGVDRRLLFLVFAAGAAAVLAVAAEGFGLIGARLWPFAQLALALVGGVAAGEWSRRRALLLAPALVLATLGGIQANAGLVRAWAEWDFGGLERKPLAPAFRALAEALRRGGDARVAVEHHAAWEQAGSARVFDLLPQLAGRATLEGLYNQAGLHAHAVYYLASELSPRAPNPFRRRTYSTFDPHTALLRLPLFNAGDVVAVSAELRAALRSSPLVTSAARVEPFEVFRLQGRDAGYVEPLLFQPVRAPRADWRERAYRWLQRKPPARALLVFSDDARRFPLVERDAWLAPPEVALPGASDVRVHSRLEAEALELTTSHPGHPLLVKVSYHPRWRAQGADGPFLVSPAMMLVIPRQTRVRLEYAARTGADRLGLLLTLAGLGVCGALAWRAWRPRASAPKPFRPKRVGPDGLPIPPRRWGAPLTLALALLLLGARLVPRGPSHADELRELASHAGEAFAVGRYADAAEYARHALERAKDDEQRRALVTLRQQSLARLAPSPAPAGDGAAPRP